MGTADMWEKITLTIITVGGIGGVTTAWAGLFIQNPIVFGIGVVLGLASIVSCVAAVLREIWRD